MAYPNIFSNLSFSYFNLAMALVLVMVLPFTTTAQTSTAQQEADKLFSQQAYHAATEKYTLNNTEDPRVLEQLAHSYRLNHDTRNAEKYYALIVDKSYDPANYLYYAQALQSNGKPELAKVYFLKYDQLMGSTGDHRGSHFVANIDMETILCDDDISLKNLSDINSEQLDYCPVILGNKMVFVSTRQSQTASPKRDMWTGEAFSSLYVVEKQQDGAFTLPELFSVSLGSTFHDGPLAFSQNGNWMYYTRNVSQKNDAGQKEKFLKIATAIKDGNQWLRDDLLDLGERPCNDVHPTLSKDGQQLVFASDRPGGYGGMDLYVACFSNGKWGMPINLGASINTAGHEVFPFLHNNGDLYFASDGQGGFGGLDVFCAKTDSYGDWTGAANIGRPFNSPKDDFGLVLDETGRQGFLTSARDGGMGRDDIYQFTSKTPLNDLPQTTSANAHSYDPIFSPRKIKLNETTTELSIKDEDPSAFLAEMESASATGAFLKLDHIYYDYGQSAIRPDAAQELDQLVQFLNDHPHLSIELISHTDARGDAAYNKELSELRAQSAANYLIQQGVNANRVVAIGMGEEQLLNECLDGRECSEEEHQINRRTEIRFY